MTDLDRLRLLVHNFEADIEFDVVPEDVDAIKALLGWVEGKGPRHRIGCSYGTGPRRAADICGCPS